MKSVIVGLTGERTTNEVNPDVVYSDGITIKVSADIGKYDIDPATTAPDGGSYATIEFVLDNGHRVTPVSANVIEDDGRVNVVLARIW